jgi:hypothetical protein
MIQPTHGTALAGDGRYKHSKRSTHMILLLDKIVIGNDHLMSPQFREERDFGTMQAPTRVRRLPAVLLQPLLVPHSFIIFPCLPHPHYVHHTIARYSNVHASTLTPFVLCIAGWNTIELVLKRLTVRASTSCLANLERQARRMTDSISRLRPCVAT